MPGLPYEGTDISLSDANIITSSRLQYPNPFFDLSRHYSPKTVKSLFKYCRIYFYQNEFIHNIILKLAEYPITDIEYEGLDDEDVRHKYNELIHHYIRLKSFLIEVGLDYFTYGNALISVNMKFKRFLECPQCGHQENIKMQPFRFTNFSFVGECKACHANPVTFIIKDAYLKNPKYLKFIRWAPESINIDYDDLTGDSRYFYTINDKVRKAIIEGKREVLERVPLLFIQSLKENKKIELDPNNLYHMKRPTLAEEDQGWGKPLLLACMKILWYMQTLRRGNEAIIADHLVPMRCIFPAQQANLDPFTSMNLGQWSANVGETLLRWRRDPNHVAIFPIPIGMQGLGGDAKMLMVTPEMKYLEESIINALGIPTEFVKGGATWTSASVSMRIVENHFLQYREQLEDMLNYFISPKIADFLKYPKVKMRLKKFRMSDDVQGKEVMVQAANMNRISNQTLWTELGLDPKKEQRLMENEGRSTAIVTREQIKAQLTGQAEGQVIMSRYQARANAEMLEETARIRERLFDPELIRELGSNRDLSETLRIYAEEIAAMPPEQQMSAMKQLTAKAPYTGGFVMRRLQDMGITFGTEEKPEPTKSKPSSGSSKK